MELKAFSKKERDAAFKIGNSDSWIKAAQYLYRIQLVEYLDVIKMSNALNQAQLRKKKLKKQEEEELEGRKIEWFVEAIVDHKVHGSVNPSVIYRVRWENHGPEDDHWKREDKMLDCVELIRDYRTQCLKELSEYRTVIFLVAAKRLAASKAEELVNLLIY